MNPKILRACHSHSLPFIFFCEANKSFLKRRDANLHLMVEKVNLWFDGSFYVLGSQESRSILRRLDRVIGFPEEGALMLRDFEHALFGGTTVKQLLQGLVKNLAKRKGQHHHRRKEQNTVLHFHRIVAHFYLVSSLLSNINQWAKNKWMKVYFPQLDIHKILGIGIKL